MCIHRDGLGGSKNLLCACVSDADTVALLSQGSDNAENACWFLHLLYLAVLKGKRGEASGYSLRLTCTLVQVSLKPLTCEPSMFKKLRDMYKPAYLDASTSQGQGLACCTSASPYSKAPHMIYSQCHNCRGKASISQQEPLAPLTSLVTAQTQPEFAYAYLQGTQCGGSAK